MTPEILYWIETVVKPLLQPSAGRVLEVGALNVNGSPRSIIEPLVSEYIGTDMQEGAGVDIAINNLSLTNEFSLNSFDTIICCECLEHDIDFVDTIRAMHMLLKSSGHLIITTPSLGFPYHAYPRHYVNFTRDAYEDIFFNNMSILDLRYLDNAPVGKNVTLAGIARK